MTWFGQGPYIPVWFRDKQVKPVVDKYHHEREGLSRYIDKPIIVISRQLIDPVVGIGRSIREDDDGSPILVISDYVSNNIVSARVGIYPYSYNFLRQYYDTDPQFVIDLLYQRSVFHAINDIDETMQHLHSLESIIETLTENGFYEQNCMRS